MLVTKNLEYCDVGWEYRPNFRRILWSKDGSLYIVNSPVVLDVLHTWGYSYHFGVVRDKWTCTHIALRSLKTILDIWTMEAPEVDWRPTESIPEDYYA